jgi:hypothetical protein
MGCGVTAMFRIGKLLHVRFPEGCKTIGDVARRMKPLAPLPTSAELAAADGASVEVRTRIIAILSERLGVPVEKISFESRLVDLAP